MKCDWEEIETPDDSGWRRVRCKRCKFVTGTTPHSLDKIHKVCSVSGIGDYVAAGLRLLGFRKKCSGCQQRQNALNELGKQIGL